MNTKSIKYAVQLAALGSSNKVAERNNISRSAVSRNIKRLEDDLGYPLFVKLQNGVVPTLNGDIFLKYARQILKVEDDLRYSLGEELAYRGNVHIGMGTNRSVMFLSNIMPEFISIYPNISVHVHEMKTHEIVNAILSRELDFGVVSKAIMADGLTFLPILEEELVMVAPDNDTFALEHSYEKGRRRYIRLEDFADKMFVSGHLGQQSTAIADKSFKAAGISPKVVFRTENCLSRILLARNSSCYALLPHSYTHVSGIITPHYHLESSASTTWKIGITYIDSAEMPRTALTLKQFIMEKIK